jgi:hypothetical protein
MQHIVKYQRKASHLLNNKNQGGTKFKIFVQPRYLEGFETPETIRVSLPPDKIKDGPSDSRMYVVDIKDKLPYSRGCPYDPQFYDKNGNPKGEYFDPPKPNQEDHYDEIDINSRSFLNTTIYATIRFSLDIWENYIGENIKWVQKENSFERLEIIPLIIQKTNAFAWEGYVEYGYSGIRPSSNFNINEIKPFCENFDVICHEFGHQIIFSNIGLTNSIKEFSGFHESAGDLVSIVNSLHFDTMVDKLLEKTKGNLFSFNILESLAELSKTTQLRHAFNNYKMSDVEKEEHDLSMPLTGAFFDIFVEVYQELLVKNKLITENLARRSLQDEAPDDPNDPVQIEIQNEYNSEYIGKEQKFKDNLLKARDYIGKLLGLLWKDLSRNDFTYSKVFEKVMQIEKNLSINEKRNSYVDIIKGCFTWREIYLPNSIIPRKLCTNFKKL